MPKKRKDGNYEKVMTFDIKGQKIRKHFYYKDEFDLVEKVNAFKTKLEERQKIYFEYVADEWYESHCEEIEGGTQICYTPAYKRAVEAFKDKEIKDITSMDIKRILERMAKQKYSAQTVRVQRIVLNLIFKHAVLNEYIDINPVSVVSVPRNLPKAKRELPSDDEITAVMQSADVPFGMFAYLILFTGCRRGEALALQWKDVDFNKKTISISKSVNYSGMNQNVPILSPHPKSDAGIREVMMLDCLANRLKDMAKDKPSDYFIFGDKEPLTKSALRKRWQKYQRETNTAFTPHQLRHAYATILYDAGIDEKVAQGLMGHSTIQLTRDIYTHVRMDRKQAAAEALNEYINNKRQSI